MRVRRRNTLSRAANTLAATPAALMPGAGARWEVEHVALAHFAQQPPTAREGWVRGEVGPAQPHRRERDVSGLHLGGVETHEVATHCLGTPAPQKVFRAHLLAVVERPSPLGGVEELEDLAPTHLREPRRGAVAAAQAKRAGRRRGQRGTLTMACKFSCSS